MISLYDVDYLIVFSDDVIIVFSEMRKVTVGAVLETFLVISEIPSAVISKCVQRAITEKAIEILHILYRMTRKEFAFLMLKKLFPS